ncbi:hypothetical protein ACFWD7_48315 [Streptomyces mirabilis]|uniref:hypothetical protein n=1 Tax=Streptomyces mirabilis TaxID=68239 RepID=UPI00368F413A
MGGLAVAVVVLISPVIPWIMFPASRKPGAVAATAWGILAIAWFLIMNERYSSFAGIIIFSSVVRVGTEVAGIFEGSREARIHRNTCDDISCEEGHQADSFTYVIAGFMTIAISTIIFMYL